MRENKGMKNHILYLAQKLCDCDPEYIIILMLGDLGAPSRPKGYEFLKVAIQRLYENPFQQLTKCLYPDVAKICDKGATGTHVERDMRHIIHKMWESRDPEVWEEYLGQGCDECPSVGEFVAKMAEAVKLWKGCSMAYRMSKKEGEK